MLGRYNNKGGWWKIFGKLKLGGMKMVEDTFGVSKIFIQNLRLYNKFMRSGEYAKVVPFF